jgi:hypothetical protein
VIAGRVQFATSTPNRLLTAAAQGKPLKAVMNVHDRMALTCFTNHQAGLGRRPGHSRQPPAHQAGRIRGNLRLGDQCNLLRRQISGAGFR